MYVSDEYVGVFSEYLEKIHDLHARRRRALKAWMVAQPTKRKQCAVVARKAARRARRIARLHAH